MHRREPVSATHQMYLKALHRLSKDHPIGRVRDIARELDVTPGTVSTALSRLQEIGLVTREHYGGAQLTAAGAAVAHCVTHRYETTKALLIEVLGIEAGTAENDACLMEHAVSPKTVGRMAALIERVRAGAVIDRDSLRDFHRTTVTHCANCEAAGVCLAAES